MRITVVGAGPVGSTLASAWARAGHEVTVVVRDPEQERHDELAGLVPVVSAAQGIRPADATLLAVPGTALSDVLHHSGPVLDGQLLIDTTNRMGRVTFHQLPLFETLTPRARVYRAFCCYGWEVFADPVIDGVRADLPFCGPGGPAASTDLLTVRKLISDVGLTPLWLGELDTAEILDGVLRLWYSLAVDRNLGRRLALRALVPQR